MNKIRDRKYFLNFHFQEERCTDEFSTIIVGCGVNSNQYRKYIPFAQQKQWDRYNYLDSPFQWWSKNMNTTRVYLIWEINIYGRMRYYRYIYINILMLLCTLYICTYYSMYNFVQVHKRIYKMYIHSAKEINDLF